MSPFTFAAENPPTVEAVAAVETEEGSILLAWVPPQGYAEVLFSYNVYGRNLSGTPVRLATLPSAVHAFPTDGTYDEYGVSLVSATGDEGETQFACAHVRPSAMPVEDKVIFEDPCPSPPW